MTRFELLVTLHVLDHIIETAVPVSAALQSPQMDINTANGLIQSTIRIFTSRRANAESSFVGIFATATTAAEQADVPLYLPRRAGRQVHRSNRGTASIEEFFRVSIYIPLLDHIVQDLEDRFQVNENGVVNKLLPLLPKKVVLLEDAEVDSVVDSLYPKYHLLILGTGKSLLRNELLL